MWKAQHHKHLKFGGAAGSTKELDDLQQGLSRISPFRGEHISCLHTLILPFPRLHILDGPLSASLAKRS